LERVEKPRRSSAPPRSSSSARPASASTPQFAPDGPPTVAKRSSEILSLRRIADTIAVPRLTIVVEREAGVAAARSFVHDGELCRIGTHTANDLVLNDRAVSRFHCKLVREGDVWRVRDSGSLNGTRLDNVLVRDADLGVDSVLALGDSVLRVTPAEAAAQAEVPLTQSFGDLVGTSVAMRKLFALLGRIAASDINVLIEGESGTGKELVATELVRHGARADKPFVIVDCGAISPSLVESELFGHVRGSFTGADRDRVGAFEAADGGTVFLDEIGELRLELQPKLLRAIEAREIRRVGETKPRRVNVRVISATNRDLEREVNKGRFREDLYFRLAVLNVRVPPLRERGEDLVTLIRVFLASLGVPAEERLFAPPVLEELARHDWPGNVRELRNYVERTVVLQKASPAARRLAASSSSPAPVDLGVPFKVAKEATIGAFERTYLAALLAACGGNMSKAARQAGMDRMYLHRLAQKHGLRGKT
jgi:DNA-binding NtrC family response regulator